MLRILVAALVVSPRHGDGWWVPPVPEPPQEEHWSHWLLDPIPGGNETWARWESWRLDPLMPTKWWSDAKTEERLEFGLWMVVDTIIGILGWAVFGTAWGRVRTGCWRVIQIGIVLGLCVVAHYVWAVCYPMVSIILALVAAVIWVLRKVLKTVGTVFFHAQKLAGGAPEASDVDFVGPGTGMVPDTSTLRSFKRTGDASKQVVVRRGNAVAVFSVGSDAQSIRTHGLYLSVEPDSVRGDSGLAKRITDCERVHLCRNFTCAEEGEGEHFLEYGVVKRFQPERFQAAQAHDGAKNLTRRLWETVWPAGASASRVLGRLRDYASESETEEAKCQATQVTWTTDGIAEVLAKRPCTEVGKPLPQVLQEDLAEGCSELHLCSKHAHLYLTKRVPLKCGCYGCNRFGETLHDGVRWCARHLPRKSPSTSAASRRSRSRSRVRGYKDDDEDADGYPADQEDEDGDPENGPAGVQDLLSEAKDAGRDVGSRPRKRVASRSPGHTPKSTIQRNLAKIGMLSSPGSEVEPKILESFMEMYADGRQDGLREEQVRDRLARDRVLTEKDVLVQLISDATEEQSKGQRGLTRFLSKWNKELDYIREKERADSDWSVVGSRPTSTSGPTSPPLFPPWTPPKGDSATPPAPSPGPSQATVEKPKEVRILPPGVYHEDRKAGSGPGEGAEHVEQIAKAIQSQTAELATLVRHQAEGSGSQPPGTVKGLTRQSEELVFLLRACGQYEVKIGEGEHGQALANGLLAAQAGSSNRLRQAGLRQRVTVRLAVGLAGPYWGTSERYALSAADFVSFTDAELDQFAYEASKNTKQHQSDQRAPAPVRFDDWIGRVRRQTDVWCLAYGAEWRMVCAKALELLSEWHLSCPHRWPLQVIMDIWEELHLQFFETLKQTLRDIKKAAGRETLTLPELRFHALAPGPDGRALLEMPTTFDLERPGSWFQSEVLPRIERKQERLLWNLTWQGPNRRDRPQGAQPSSSAGGADVEPGKPTMKQLWGPKLTNEEVSRAKERAPVDKSGSLLCWGHLCHVGCSTQGCQRSHEGLRGTFESLDPCVQMQLLRRGGLRRMKMESKDTVATKIKELRSRIEKDKTEKVADGRKRAATKAGHQEKPAGTVDDATTSKAGGTVVKQVQFWEPPEEFQVDFTKDEKELQDLVAGPDPSWVQNTFTPAHVHGGRDGDSATEEAKALVRDCLCLWHVVDGTDVAVCTEACHIQFQL
eukprot:Skav208504  [mRNA]  locus=scaffold1658:140020:151562:+ [translate_table: standard]